VSTHLYVATVMAAGRELDSAEGDGALQGHLDGRLLHPILSIGPRGARDGATTEVPLYWHGEGKGLSKVPSPGNMTTAPLTTPPTSTLH
jgi:hypothetical protein